MPSQANKMQKLNIHKNNLRLILHNYLVKPRFSGSVNKFSIVHTWQNGEKKYQPLHMIIRPMLYTPDAIQQKVYQNTYHLLGPKQNANIYRRGWGCEVLNSKLASQLSLEASMINLFMSSSIFLNQFPISSMINL